MPIKELLVDVDPTKAPAEIKAKRRILSRILEGIWTTIIKGRGIEFAGYRQYTFGDDASKIDWNASLRSKQTLVREYEEYKTVNVFFLLDLNDSMLFTTQEKLKCEYAAELMFHLAYAVSDNDEAVGYALFTDELVKHQQPTVGRDILFHLENDLTDGNNYGGKSDFKRCLLLSQSMLGSRAIVILISDFIMLPENWEKYIEILATRYQLIGIMVRDPRDEEIVPMPMQAIVEDPKGKERMLIDFKQYAHRFQRETNTQAEHVESVFTKSKAGFLRVNTRDDALDQLIHYFSKKFRIREG